MEKRHKNIICSNYGELSSAIGGQINAVSKDLLNKQILSERLFEEIVEAPKTSLGRAEALLDRIQHRGPRAFNELYQSILKFQLYDAANILNPDIDHWRTDPSLQGVDSHSDDIVDNEDDIDGDEDDVDLPDRWPLEEPQTKLRVRHVVEGSQMFKKYRKTVGLQNNYQLKNSPRGRVLIINNINFQHCAARKGSEMDEEGLTNMFTQLDFDVIVQKDKTVDEMREILNKESQMDHTKFDCFILVILSHGLKGGVYGIDGEMVHGVARNYIKLREIKDMFDATETLIGKPKLFFIQACQGNNGNFGKKKPEEESDGAHSSDLESECNWDSGVSETLEDLIPFEEADSFHKVPQSADVYIAMSTTPGMVSIRHIIKGTWFIQAVIYVFSKFADRFDIQDLMLKVNQLVCRSETMRGLKQVAEMRSTLTKKFYFFPGLSQLNRK